ncbi:hypothetical protein Emag_003927 [Eimeria magna]
MCAPPGPTTPSSPRPPTGSIAEADAAAASPHSNECPAEATDENISASSQGTERLAATSATADSASGDVEGADGEATPPDEAAGRQRRNRWADESDDLDSPAFDPMTTTATPPPLILDSRGDFLPPPAPRGVAVVADGLRDPRSFGLAVFASVFSVEDRGLRDLLVSELDGRTTERDLMQLFQGVKKVRIRKGDSGRRPNSVSAIVSFVSHEAVCAALAMNGRPYPRRGGGSLGGAHRGDRHKGGTGILRVQVPPRDSLDVCFSKFRTGGLGGAQSAAVAVTDRGGGVDGGTALSSGGGAAASSSSSSPSRGGSWGSGRAAGAELKWRKHLKSPEGAAPAAAGAAGGAAASIKEQQHQRQNHEAISNNTTGGSSSPGVALVAPKDLLKEQLKPQGLKLNPAIFGEAKPRDEASLPQKQKDTREGLSRQGSPPSIMSVLQQGMLAPPPPPSPQQHRQQQQPHPQKQQPPQPPEQQQRWRSGLLPQQQQQHQQQQSSSDRPRRRQDPLCGARPRDETPLMSAPKQQQLLQQRASPLSRSQHAPVHANQGSASGAGVAAGAVESGAAGHAEARDSLSTLTEKPANATNTRRTDGWGNWSRVTGAQEDTANPLRRGWRVGPASSSNSSSGSAMRAGETSTDGAFKESSTAGEIRRRGNPKVADVPAACASSTNGHAEQQVEQPEQDKQSQSGEALGKAAASRDVLASSSLQDPTADQQQNDEHQQHGQQQTAQRKLKRGLAWQSKGEVLKEAPQEPCGSHEGPSLACEPTGAPPSPSHLLRQQQQQQGFGQGFSGGREERRGLRGDKRVGGGQGGSGVQGRGGGGSVVRWGPGGASVDASATPTQRPAGSEDQRPGQRVTADRFGAESTSSSNSSSNSSGNALPRMQSRERFQRVRGGLDGSGALGPLGASVTTTQKASVTKNTGGIMVGFEGSPTSNTLRAAIEEEGATPGLSTSSRETTAASALAVGEGKAKVASQQQRQQHQDAGKMRLENNGSLSQQEV